MIVPVGAFSCWLLLVPVPLAVGDAGLAGGGDTSASAETGLDAGASVVATNRPRRVLRRSEKQRDAGRSTVLPSRIGKPTGVFGASWPLCVVLGLVGLFAIGARRWMPRSGRWGGGEAIRVLARRSLGGKQSLCLVRLGRRLVLVGITPDRITSLLEVGQPEEVASLLGDLERARPESFTSMFAKFTTREAASEPDAVEDGGREVVKDDLVVSSAGLEQAGGRVRDLVQRVRALSSGVQTSAEST
ncbi:MAG: FliO/MopB family protein [Phycisphaerae bacterium]